jgi:hypothetical protein
MVRDYTLTDLLYIAMAFLEKGDYVGYQKLMDEIRP